ncbi:MAG TPA: SPFH domain-containing protein [Candidatus Lokiarchaeia archaeon]|nr:SPFH domain-containing protein [Candidatus Lokiarchaeia archaeon]
MIYQATVDLSQYVWLFIVAGILIGLVLLIFFFSRYKKFRTNEFVIHLRNGKLKSAGMGGKLFKLPIFDDVIVIPTTTQQTTLEAHQNLVTRELQDISLEAYLYWKVIRPEVAYTAVSWDGKASNFVEHVLRNATEAIIRTTCANMELETIIRERMAIIKAIADRLHEIVTDWGIVIESIEIKEVHILDEGLKHNMEQLKKSMMEQEARIAKARAEEASRTQELLVQQKVGIQEQETEQSIQLKSKEREIAVADQERERVKIEADQGRQQKIIQADGESQQIKMKLTAQAEGEAQKIRQQMLAQAEGFQSQVEAMKLADERFLAVQMINALPDVFSNIKPDKMVVIGDSENSFGSLAKSIIPFLQIIPHVSEDIVKMFKGKKEKDEQEE